MRIAGRTKIWKNRII